MPDVNTPDSPDNRKVDPLTAFVARAQARAALFAHGEIRLHELLALAFEAADAGLMREDEALAILRAALRLQQRRMRWL